MGTHPIFESDFDCLTDQRCEMENLQIMAERMASQKIQNQEDISAALKEFQQVKDENQKFQKRINKLEAEKEKMTRKWRATKKQSDDRLEIINKQKVIINKQKKENKGLLKSRDWNRGKNQVNVITDQMTQVLRPRIDNTNKLGHANAPGMIFSQSKFNLQSQINDEDCEMSSLSHNS